MTVTENCKAKKKKNSSCALKKIFRVFVLQMNYYQMLIIYYVLFFKVNEFLAFEGPILLDMRIKHLIKTNQLSQATALAKLCSDHPEIGTKGSFKQTYLVCLCTSSPNEKLIEEVSMFSFVSNYFKK